MDYNKIRKEEHRKKRKKHMPGILGILTVILGIFVGIGLFVLVSVDNQTENIADENDTQQRDGKMQTVQPTDAPADTVPTAEPTAVPTAAPTAAAVKKRGRAEDIPEDKRKEMDGCSMHDNPNISYDDLSYLTIPYHDFNGGEGIGHMVVNKKCVEDVLNIFAELYEVGYPIERMELVDEYGADDYASIEANNTSAFNYRVSTDGSNRLSKHALGRAIDINPKINPYVDANGKGAHENAREYWSRNPENWKNEISYDKAARKAYIGPGTEIYDIFIKYGWEWGGSWSSYRDYQHFQKPE